jgi:hypothetical protein
MLSLALDLALYAAVLLLIAAVVISILLGLFTLGLCLGEPGNEYCPMGLMFTAASLIPVMGLAAIMGVIVWLARRCV